MNKKTYSEFGMELAKAIMEFEKYATYSLLDGNVFRFANYSISLNDLTCEDNVDEVEKLIHQEIKNVSEFCGYNCSCYLSCEGDLYEALYYYEAKGAKLGDTDETERLYDSVNAVCSKFHLYYEFEDGALGFYKEVKA